MSHRNNLDAVRLVAASLVLYGHSFVFLGLKAPLFLSWLPLGPLGVFIFFTISGYLVIESWDRDQNALRFFVRRMLRIFPGLAVCILLSVFVLGPILTTLPLKDYFENHYTWGYLRNIALYIGYYLPGVFESNRLPNAVNGSLWSLPVEFLMYISVAIIGLLRGNRWLFAVLAVASGAITLFWAWRDSEMFVIYAFDLRQAFICGTYFWVGAVFYKFDLKRYFTLSVAVMACIAIVCLEPWVEVLRMAAWVLLPTVVLAFGLSHSPILIRLTRSGDYSYGIYIYAFPIQQTVAKFWPQMPLGLYLAITATATLVMAALSWHWVEHPALRLKPTQRRNSDPAEEPLKLKKLSWGQKYDA